MTKHDKIQRLLKEPFPIGYHEVKPGAGGGQGQVLALPFIPWHYYQERLDLAVGWQNWGVSYKFLDVETVYAEITICGVTKGDVGEVEEEGDGGPPNKRRGANPLFGGVAQAFRRACAVFGLGRYLYELDRYYAPSNGKQITEAAGDIVYKLLHKAGLDPLTRHQRAISAAKDIGELLEVGELIAISSRAKELQDKEYKELKVAFGEQKKKLPPAAPSSSPAEAPAVPSWMANTRIGRAAQAEAEAKAAPWSSPEGKELFASPSPSEALADYKALIAELPPGAKASDLYIKALRLSISDSARLGRCSPGEVAELLELLRHQLNAKPPAPAAASSSSGSLKPAAPGMRPPDYDNAEAKARGATTEEREASYMKEIEASADLKTIDALGSELEKDRALTSAAVKRLKDKVLKRRTAIDTRQRIDNAPRISQGRPPAAEPKSSELLGYEAKIRAVTTIEGLNTIISEAGLKLSNKDGEALDPACIAKRLELERAAEAIAELQEPLI